MDSPALRWASAGHAAIDSAISAVGRAWRIIPPLSSAVAEDASPSGAGGKMLLPKQVERLEHAALVDMPERPAVAGWSALKRGTDLVDGPGMHFACERAVSADACRPASLRVRQDCARGNEAAFHQYAEGDA